MQAPARHAGENAKRPRTEIRPGPLARVCERRSYLTLTLMVRDVADVCVASPAYCA